MPPLYGANFLDDLEWTVPSEVQFIQPLAAVVQYLVSNFIFLAVLISVLMRVVLNFVLCFHDFVG